MPATGCSVGSKPVTLVALAQMENAMALRESIKYKGFREKALSSQLSDSEHALSSPQPTQSGKLQTFISAAPSVAPSSEIREDSRMS